MEQVQAPTCQMPRETGRCMTQGLALSQAEMAAWAKLINKAVGSAVAGLSNMVGRQMKATALKVGQIPAATLPNLMGGPEAVMVGIYLGFNGSATGHMVLAYHPKMALEFVDMLMGMPSGSTNDIGEMEKSALQEMGNVMGGLFLNTIADENGLRLCPTPPVTMVDKAAVLLNVALSGTVEREEEILVVDAVLGTEEKQSSGTFMVVPGPGLMQVLRERWAMS